MKGDRQLRTLVTGGAGFIGSHLAAALLNRGDDVTIVDDLSTGDFEAVQHLTRNPHFHFAIDSISNETLMDRLVSECDLVYHLAAAVGVGLVMQSTVDSIETNVLGTHAVLCLASCHGARVLLASSSEVYGKSKEVPFREDRDGVLGPTTRSRWSYAASKAVDEFMALAYFRERGLRVVVVRLFNTVGPGQTGRYGMVVPRLVGQATRREPLTVYGDGLQTRCFCDVRDAVRGIMALADCCEAEGEVVNLGGTEEVTISGLAERIVRLTGSDSEISYVPYGRVYGAGFEDVRRRVPDVSRIEALTGWKPRFSLDDTLRSVIDSLDMAVDSSS